MGRREFLKKLGLGAAVSAGALAGCAPAAKKVVDAAGTGGEPTGKMTYRKNNKGDEVSLLGYGCMRWPTKPVEGTEDKEIDQEAVNELIDYAMAHGVNYYDTAPPYMKGKSEEATGIALSRHPRNSYYLATKLSNFSPETWSYDGSVAIYRRSFERLKTDYFDYMLLHAIGGGDDGVASTKQRFIDNGVLDFLLAEREAGRIRNLGFSYHGDIRAFDYLLKLHDEGKAKWDFVQIQLNYCDWKHASEGNYNADYLYNELAKRNIPVVVMEPLLGGRLATLNDALNARLKQERPDDSVASWAFRFAGSWPKVLTVLSGMTYMEHLQDNLRTYSPLEPCSEQEKALLEDTAVKLLSYPTVGCTGCQYCMPCPYGIDIPGVFAYYNKCVNEGNTPSSVGDPDYRRARRAFLVGYDRNIDKVRQADHCIGCGQCKEHCPQTIDIPAQMTRINAFVENLKQDTL